jgi:polyferredoxin
MSQAKLRIITKLGFFLLFLCAPILDIFRFDLTLGHFILFGQAWSLNVESIMQHGDSVDAALRIFSRVLLPLVGFIVVTGLIIYRYGRIYCGWLCPHFSVVEIINDLMLKQLNRITVWEKASAASQGVLPKLVVFLAALAIALLWALALLSYLLPPIPLLNDFIHFQLGFGSTIFVTAATVVFTADFIFARHLFCKYGCALGLFQSLIWMANNKAMVVKFDRARAKACRECGLQQAQKPCDAACPMRLPTRNMKRAKFTCTQCTQCVSACAEVQKHNPDGPLLKWAIGKEAVEVDRKAVKTYTPDIAIKQINK